MEEGGFSIKIGISARIRPVVVHAFADVHGAQVSGLDLAWKLSAPNFRGTPLWEHRVLLEHFAEFFKSLHAVVTDLNFHAILDVNEHIFRSKMSMCDGSLETSLILTLLMLKQLDLKQSLRESYCNLMLVRTGQSLRALVDQVKERHLLRKVNVKCLLPLQKVDSLNSH